MPNKTSTMVNNALNGNYDEARTLSNELFNLMDVLFIEASPAPTKRALNLMGMDVGGLRMPINEICDENEVILKEILKENNLI